MSYDPDIDTYKLCDLFVSMIILGAKPGNIWGLFLALCLGNIPNNADGSVVSYIQNKYTPGPSIVLICDF